MGLSKLTGLFEGRGRGVRRLYKVVSGHRAVLGVSWDAVSKDISTAIRVMRIANSYKYSCLVLTL